MAKAEGKTFDFFDETHIDPEQIEVFDFDSPEPVSYTHLTLPTICSV